MPPPIDLGFLELPFVPKIPGEQEIVQGWAIPGFYDEFDRKLGNNARLAIKYAAGEALALLPEGTANYNEIAGYLVELVEAPSVDVASELYAKIHGAVLDIAMDAVGAVPIIGQIMKGIIQVVMIFARWLAKSEVKPKPKLTGYTQQSDISRARDVQDLLLSRDWTRIWLPVGAGDWERIRADLPSGKGAYVFRQSQGGPGLGSFPGSGAGQLAVVWQIKFPSGHQHWPWSKKRAREARENATDLYDQHPSAAQLATAAWALLMSTETSAILNVDASVLYPSWRDTVRSAREYAFDQMLWTTRDDLGRLTDPTVEHGIGEPGERFLEEKAGSYYAIDKAFRVGSTEQVDNGGGKYADDVVLEAAKELESRQLSAVLTLPRRVIEGSAALNNPKVAKAYALRPLVSQVPAVFKKFKKPPPPRMPMGGMLGEPTPRRRRGLSLWWLLAAAGAGGGVYLWRRPKARHKVVGKLRAIRRRLPV